MGRLGSMGRLHSMRRRDDPSSRGLGHMGDGLTGESRDPKQQRGGYSCYEWDIIY